MPGLLDIGPHHALSLGTDVEGEARRLRDHLHGGDQQGDLGDAHRAERAGARRRGDVPPGLRGLGVRGGCLVCVKIHGRFASSEEKGI